MQSSILSELYSEQELTFEKEDKTGGTSTVLLGCSEWPPNRCEIAYDKFLGVEAWQGPPKAPDCHGYGQASNKYRFRDHYGYKYECTRLVKRFVEKVYRCPLNNTGDGLEMAPKLSNKCGSIINNNTITEIKLEYHPAGSEISPMVGSIVSTCGPKLENGMGYGHVFIIKGYEIIKKNQNGSPSEVHAYMFEQNFSKWVDNKIVFPIGNATIFQLKSNCGWEGCAYGDSDYPVIGWVNPVRVL